MSDIVAKQPQNLSVWGHTTKSNQNISKARSLLSLTHGMYAGVPIICKGPECPYRSTCPIEESELEIEERCPVEIASILERFDRYCHSLNIDPNDERNTVDLGFVKDLIDIEIMLLRADQKMAINADFIDQVVSAVSPTGDVYYTNQLTPAFEMKERLWKQRQKILDLLNSTRKAKEQSLKGMIDASTAAAKLMARVKELKQQGALEINDDFVEAEVIEMEDKEGES